MIPEETRKERLERAARFTAQRTAASLSDLPAIAAKADDLEAIKKAVEDAAAVSGAVWLPYLFTLLYLADATATVSQTDLLLENSVKLPYLNIQLPLLAFFLLAPALVIVIHAYALVYFGMLGQKASWFHDELKRQLPDATDAPDQVSPKEIRDKLRRLLPSNIFVQMLAGPPELRGGMFGFVLKLIALTTLVLSPVFLLLFLQFQFLPYHDVVITWTQRAALILDIGLLWVLRPATLSGGIGGWSLEGGEGDPSSKRILGLHVVGLGIAGVLCLSAIWLAVVVATFPGEWQNGALAWLDPPLWKSIYFDDEGQEQTKAVSLRKFLFMGAVDPITGRRRSPFSNTLVLPGFNVFDALKVDDPKKLAWRDFYIDLADRHLEEAVLDAAVLTKANLKGAHLQGASLDDVRLEGASLDLARLQGVSLQFAHLEGGSLRNANLEGAVLHFADLDGADMQGAALGGASFSEAELFGASLELASLNDATFRGAHLEGASLKGSHMLATDLSEAYLWSANFNDGLPYVFPWVNGHDSAKWASDPIVQSLDALYPYAKTSLENVPEGQLRENALKRIERLDCSKRNEGLPACNADAEPPPNVAYQWHKIDEDRYRKRLSGELGTLVCSDDSYAIYILHGLMYKGKPHLAMAPVQTRVADLDNEGAAFAKEVMNCPVSALLTEGDRAELLKLDNERSSSN